MHREETKTKTNKQKVKTKELMVTNVIQTLDYFVCTKKRPLLIVLNSITAIRQKTNNITKQITKNNNNLMIICLIIEIKKTFFNV
jgi:hypothetical protein